MSEASNLEVKDIISTIQESVESFAVTNEKIASETNLLALNAAIEAAHAGEAGKTFTVVATAVKSLAAQAAENSKNLRQTVIGEINAQSQEITRQFEERDSSRLTEMAQTMVQLIVRNLYERTADVRWWATDEAFYRCLEDGSAESCAHATDRLRIINRFYSVYLNLVLADIDGNLVSVSDPERFSKAVGANVSSLRWFHEAVKTSSGDDYIVDDIYNDPLNNDLPVAVYSAAVRRGGKMNGEILGVLGVFFNWSDQSNIVVRDEPNLSEEEWTRSQVLLLDNNYRVIAASDERKLLEPYRLNNHEKTKGCYTLDDGSVIAFARTIGYQEYDGLGWYGVIIQQPKGR